MSPRQIVASYFVIQAIGTTGWWGLLIAYPPSVKWFQPADWPADSLLSFWLADFVLIIAGSIIAATGVLRRSCWAGNVVWSVAVVTWYPTLVCLATSMQTGEAWIASAYAVLVYSLAGAVLWHIAVRPVEESDLNSRFGDAYNEYQRRVKLWIPTFGQNAIQIMNPVERESR